MNRLKALITLNMIPQLGSIRIKKLLDHFGSADNIFGASSIELQKIEGIGKTIAQNTLKAPDTIDVNKELELIDRYNAGVLTWDDIDYPESLKTIYDPPPVLYVKGEIITQDSFAIAIVGSRRASFYGLSMAEKLASQLAELGITVVSGMARGIDAASHRGALKSRGRTIAVLGSGLNVVYPPENTHLFKEIGESGAVVSEFPMQTKPLASNFPRRNRIISGLSKGVVVVEASRNSGALITADFALEQSREVFAVPGKIDSSNSFGTNRLIKQGAKLIESAEDIIEELRPKIKSYLKQLKAKEHTELKPTPSFSLTSQEDTIYNNLSTQPKYIDEIINESGLSTEKVLATLLTMEIKHLVKQLPGKLFVRNYAEITRNS